MDPLNKLNNLKKANSQEEYKVNIHCDSDSRLLKVIFIDNKLMDTEIENINADWQNQSSIHNYYIIQNKITLSANTPVSKNKK